MDREWAATFDPDILLADGFEDAFLGIIERCGSQPCAVYDYAKCVSILMDKDGIAYEEAVEYIDFNVVGAYMGPQTPWFLYRPE